jgi:hypothetical protein
MVSAVGGKDAKLSTAVRRRRPPTGRMAGKASPAFEGSLPDAGSVGGLFGQSVRLVAPLLMVAMALVVGSAIFVERFEGPSDGTVVVLSDNCLEQRCSLARS